MRNIFMCSKCRKDTPRDKLFAIDNELICAFCLYGKSNPFYVYPIGVVKNNLKLSGSDFGVVGDKGLSCIELYASQKRFLYKIEDEKHITIIYYLHKSDNVASVFKRGLDGKRVGVFASRTPRRLSRIGIQDVTLVNVKGTTLYVDGLDAVNGTPVIDIKMSWSADN